MKGTGNQQDYGIRIYDPRLGRFLSVDPITRGYPMLTPYQFASNRPIDGIDLDGKEWTKTETYDPKTGITNVKFQVCLQIDNNSKIFKDVGKLKEEIHSQFIQAFNNAYHSGSKTQYSADIEFEDVEKIDPNSGFGVSLYDRPKPNKIAGFESDNVNTKVNEFSVAVGEFDPENESDVTAINSATIENFAQTIVHELGHTAGIIHPMQPNGAPDVQLVPEKTEVTPKGTRVLSYKPGERASLELIIKNIMPYGFTPVNGKPIKEYQPDPLKRGEFSPDQSKQIQMQIDKDEKKKLA